MSQEEQTKTSELKIVQFTHPGEEHGPDCKNGNHKAWNQGSHKRKFLQSTGKYIDHNDQLQSGELMFWGEWEPPSNIKKLIKKDRSPQWLHIPYLPAQTLKPAQTTKCNPTKVIPCKPTCGKPSAKSIKPLNNGESSCCGQNTDPFVFGDSFKTVSKKSNTDGKTRARFSDSIWINKW